MSSIALEDVVAIGRSGDLVGAHVSHSCSHGGRESHIAPYREAFEVRASPAEIGVGQTVDINLVGLELEHVVVRLFNPLLALCAGTFADGFNHLDFPRFCKW